MKRIIQIKIVLVSVIVLFAYNQCGNPYTPSPTELRFDSGGGNNILSTNDSLEAFENSVYRVTRARCIGCHSSQNPIHAHDDVKTAHDIVVDQFKVNFSNIANSRLVAKLRDEAHNCWSDCSENANEMQEAIAVWAEVVNREDDSDSNDQGDNNQGGDITPGLDSKVAFEQSVYNITKNRCTTCHISIFPKHANPSSLVAHDDIVNGGAVDFDNPESSRLVQRLSSDRHNCWSNCADNAAEMKSAVETWKALMADTVNPSGADANTTAQSQSVAVVIAASPNGEGVLEYDLSEMLGVSEEVKLRIKISEFDEFSYQLWEPEIISNSLRVKVKNMKTLINGYYNPQHSAYTVVDTVTTPQMGMLSSYYLLALKDQGAALDKFSFQFEIIMID